ncbi:MAG: DoxX family protein [Anaerolineaceae bacterium]|nr:DoxX family protein [Anaerolineaceae bacterium]
MSNIISKSGRIIEDPPLARFLFSDTRMAWLWTIVRVLLGLSWIDAASHKLNSAAWMETGEALKGFWLGALAIPDGGKSKIAFDWYRQFLQGMVDNGSYVWFAKLIAVGELLVGIGLIVGAFVGIAAFFGALMNWNFIMAGSASTNGLLLVGAIVLVLAWKIAGYYGADYFLLRYLGTPWRGHKVDEPKEPIATGQLASPGKA